MKRITGLLLLLAPFVLYSQQQQDMSNKKPEPEQHKSIGIGIKAGFNFSNVTNASEVNGSSRTGYHFGLFLAPSSKSILSSRTELIYSRHGYNYADSNNSTSGSVNLDYIMLAQLMAINITKYVQIQIGAQTSYLLSAKADSSRPSTGNASADQAISYYNRIDYGYGAGVEIHPVAGFLIGARYNVSLANLYKQSFSFTPGSPPPSFIPNTSSINLKNNVVQLFLGYRF
jgi:opacity protein-like surface antigen